MNTTQQDELAQLFAQNMYLQQAPAGQQQQQQQQNSSVQETQQPPEGKIETPVHFASAHYTHTAHVRSETQSEPSRSPPPPYHEASMPEAMAETLRQHSIDPLALLPNQINLFLNADYEQRLRLLELWRISPPSYPLEKHLQIQAQWVPTSMEREANEARDRYETQMCPRNVPQEEHMVDTIVMDEAGQGFQPAARMRAASIAEGVSPTRPSEAEPYIVNGYEIAQNKHHVDPVYAVGLWQAPSYGHAVQQPQTTMEDQYGMYEQIRNHADWERMNERMAREKFVGMHEPVSMDDDMVM